MADFSFLSDTDESAVDEILAEAADHVALKQIAALNLSSFSDSVLPSHLESRFRRLKTFPSVAAASASAPNPPDSTLPDLGPTPQTTPIDKPRSDSGSAKPKSRSGSSRRRRSPSPSSSSSAGSSTSWLEKEIGSLSPPSRKSGSGLGCSWWSPKKALRKLSFANRSGGGGGGNDAVLEGIGKEQQRILKRAAKEEMKISLEAEKIVNWAKQVSGRMEDFRLTDDDDDELKNYK